MQSKLIEKIKFQKKIPIIGKGSSLEISNNFTRLIKEDFEVIEITLRSHDALDTARSMKEQYPNAIIGIGSIKSLKVLKQVSSYNFDFYVSPGINRHLLEFSNKNKLNYIPGVSTPSEIMTAIEYDYSILKFFHAERNGGVQSLQFLFEVFDNIKFLPTGGITSKNYESYLDLPNVLSVGSTGF